MSIIYNVLSYLLDSTYFWIHNVFVLSITPNGHWMSSICSSIWEYVKQSVTIILDAIYFFLMKPIELADILILYYGLPYAEYANISWLSVGKFVDDLVNG